MIAHSYRYKKPAELENFSANIILRLTQNALFTAIKTEILGELEPKHKAFSAAKLDCETCGGDDRIKSRDSSRQILLDGLDLIALKIEVFANKEADTIAAAGYELRKTKSKSVKKVAVPLTPPTNFTVYNTLNAISGELVLSWNAVEGALTYGLEQRVFGETAWKNGVYTSKSKLELSGYTRGSHHEFQIFAIGEGENRSEMSAIVEIWVN